MYWESLTIGLFVRGGDITSRKRRFNVYCCKLSKSVLLWHRWHHITKLHHSHLQHAAQLFLRSSVGDCFRRWRRLFTSKVGQQQRMQRAMSHLLCTSRRGLFDRWRQGILSQQHSRTLLLPYQRQAIAALRLQVVEYHTSRAQWSLVAHFVTQHRERQTFDKW